MHKLFQGRVHTLLTADAKLSAPQGILAKLAALTSKE